MIAAGLLFVAFPALLILAAGWDLTTYTIPNMLSGIIVVLFFVFASVCGLGLTQIGYHTLSGLLALAIGFVFFALHFVGGGDAKLFAAVALWFGLPDLLIYALVASILGGGVTLGLLWLRRLSLPAAFLRQEWIMRLHAPTSGIPYGVALATGALLILPYTEIFALL